MFWNIYNHVVIPNILYSEKTLSDSGTVNVEKTSSRSKSAKNSKSIFNEELLKSINRR